MNNLHTTFNTLYRKVYTFIGLSLALGTFAGWQWLYGIMGAYGLVVGVIAVLIATEWAQEKAHEMWKFVVRDRRFGGENVVDFEKRKRKVGVSR